MANMIAHILSHLTGSIESSANAEKVRRIYVVNLFSIVGMVITFAMATSSIFQGNWALVVVLYIASLVYLIGLLAQRYTKNTKIAARIILYSLEVLLLYLVSSGGVAGTGPLWIYILAPVSYFIHGLKRGTYDNLIFIILISVILFYPKESLLNIHYTDEFKIRLIISYITVAFLAGYYELTRMQAFKHTLKLSKEFEKLAKQDSLTGLSNRRDALEKIDYELNRSTRTGEPLGILLCDIDHFKKVNDTYGHEAGDKVLKELASFFARQSRSMDIISRWGGEEFLIVLPQTDIHQAKQYANKLQTKLVGLTVYFEKHLINCTISIGVSQFDKHTAIKEVLRRTDDALYRAKNNGRNQIVTTDEL